MMGRAHDVASSDAGRLVEVSDPLLDRFQVPLEQTSALMTERERNK